jgi:Rieske Fe-S protein
MPTDKISRRALGGLAAAGVGVPLLAACSSNDPESAADPNTSSSATPGSTPGASSSSGGSAGGGDVLTETSDIKVGGGEVFPDQQVVVTQPKAGEFKCFTAVCSHQGCIVANVSGGTINCDCHGSQYSIDDGSVVTGPATFPLAEEKITVSGNEITLNG